MDAKEEVTNKVTRLHQDTSIGRAEKVEGDIIPITPSEKINTTGISTPIPKHLQNIV